MNKIISRKLIVLLSFIIVSAQFISILAYHASISLVHAQTTGTTTIVTMNLHAGGVTAINGMIFNGTEIFQVGINPSMVMITDGPSAPLTSVTFYLDTSETLHLNPGMTAVYDGTNWITDSPIPGSLAEGSYIYYAKAIYSSGIYEAVAESPHYNVTIDRKPKAPSGLAVVGTPTATSISLGWVDNSTIEDKFNVERKLTTATNWTGAWSVLLPTANTISYTDTSVVSGTSYDYRVQACRSTFGCSDYTYLIGISSASSAPVAPSGLILSGTQNAASISLSWTDNANNEDRFTVHRKLSSASWNDFVPNNNNSFLISYPNVTSYTDTTVTSGVVYDYRVAACTIGGGCSGYANLNGVSASTGNSLPLPPSSVTASSSAGKIRAEWPVSTSAAKYSIYRKTNSGSYQIWYTNITSLYFEDIYPNVAMSSTYQYKVLGCDVDGTTCSSVGTESNIVSYTGGAVSCTSLNLTLNDGKTNYMVGDFVNYTWTCSPGGTAGNVSIWLHKPDGSLVNYNYGSGSTQTMGFDTANLVPGAYNLKACFDSNCSVVTASQSFTVFSNTSTTPTPTPFPYSNTNSINTPTSLTAVIDTITSTSYTAPTVISGTKLASITSNSSFPTGTLTFYLYKYSSVGVVDTSINYYSSTVSNIALVSGSEGKKWSGNINTNYLANSFYKFFVKGTYDGAEYMSNSVYFAINNSTAPTPTPASTPVPTVNPDAFIISVGVNSSVSGSVLSGTRTVWANGSSPLTGSVTFKFYNTATNVFSAYIVTGYPSTTTSPDTFGNYNYWLGNLDTNKLKNGSYKLVVVGIYKEKSYENKVDFYFNVNNPVPTSTPVPSAAPKFSPVPTAAPSVSLAPSPSPAGISANDPKFSPAPFAANSTPVASPDTVLISAECKEKGITALAECEQYLLIPKP